MNTLATPNDGVRPLVWCRDTLREWGWRHSALGVLIGALALFNMGGVFFFPAEFAYGRNLVYNIVEFGLPAVFALRVADRAAADGVPRLLAYGAAVVGVITLGVWVIGPLLSPIIGGEADWNAADDAALAFSLLLPLAVATVAYAAWRRGHDALLRLQAAEVERARQEQIVQSSRLLAQQARVEPQLLFDALGGVREAIGHDGAGADAAERRLGDLIALLRALQPAAGATASTLGREVLLVQAYARVSDAPALQPPRLMLQIDDAVAAARFAPLVLLPALRALAGDAPHCGWQASATQHHDRLHVEITPSSINDSALTALALIDSRALGQRLTSVHGPSARLQTSTGPRPALHIDVPFEAISDNTPSDDDDSTRPDR